MFSPAIRDLTKPQWLRIIALLKEHGGLSIPAICEKSDSSYMTVKAHCEELTKHSYLERTRLPRQQTGRPEIQYSLSPQAQELFMRPEQSLALGLLAEARALYGETAPERLIHQWLNQLSSRWRLTISRRGNLDERIRTLAKLRNDDGWLSRADEQSRQLIDHHHPLHRVHVDYPKTKVVETRILEELMGCRITREEISTGRNSPPRIVYRFD